MNTADLNRRLESLLRLGTIAEVDHAAHKIRVQSGDLKTNWLDWPAEIGRNYTRWRPLRIGTQVLLGCISGDPAQAQIIGMLYTDAFNTPSDDPDIDLIQFDDGSYIKHTHSANKLEFHSAGELRLSGESIRILGPVTQTGGDMTSDGVSAQHHKTTGVVAGTDLSGDPQ